MRSRIQKTLLLEPTPLRVASLITALDVLIASGFAIVGLVSPKSILPLGYVPTNASFLFALYAAARAIPLALATFAAIYKRSASAIIVLGALAGAIQLFDAAIGAFQNDPGKILGPLVIAGLQFYAIFTLRKSGAGQGPA
ncbi:hypothetical protein [Methylocapsa sp. S129]|uniref:hypothetical protein n=1 Tax=Methylocapsa sp. S129 TaxID=1641869 RepID=UPI00131B26EA|nr:hypothetical protein [Methylocapsa sp. S129]